MGSVQGAGTSTNGEQKNRMQTVGEKRNEYDKVHHINAAAVNSD